MTGYSREAVVDLLFHELDVRVQAEHRTQPCRDRVRQHWCESPQRRRGVGPRARSRGLLITRNCAIEVLDGWFRCYRPRHTEKLARLWKRIPFMSCGMRQERPISRSFVDWHAN